MPVIIASSKLVKETCGALTEGNVANNEKVRIYMLHGLKCFRNMVLIWHCGATIIHTRELVLFTMRLVQLMGHTCCHWCRGFIL